MGSCKQVGASRAELDLSSCVTWGESPKFSELLLPWDLQKLHSKVIDGCFSFSTLCGYFWGVGAPHHPDPDTGDRCGGPSPGHRMDGQDFLYFSQHGRSPCILSDSPKALGLLQLDCNSLCKSRSCRCCHSFVFKGRLAEGAAASFAGSL